MEAFMEKIDIDKLSAETRWRLMRFAETFDKRAKTVRSITEPSGPPGSLAGHELVEHEESPFDEDLLDCRKDLKNCSEPEVRVILDQMDVGKILVELDKKHGPLPHTKAVREEYTAAYLEKKRMEQIVVELGRKCGEFIKHLKQK